MGFCAESEIRQIRQGGVRVALAALVAALAFSLIASETAAAAEPPVCSPLEATLTFDEYLEFAPSEFCANPTLISQCVLFMDSAGTEAGGIFTPYNPQGSSVTVFTPWRTGELTGEYHCRYNNSVNNEPVDILFHVLPGAMQPEEPSPPAVTPSPPPANVAPNLHLIKQPRLSASTWFWFRKTKKAVGTKATTISFLIPEDPTGMLKMPFSLRADVPVGRRLGRGRTCVLPTHPRAGKRHCSNPGGALSRTVWLKIGFNTISLTSREQRALIKLMRFEPGFSFSIAAFNPYARYELGRIAIKKR